MQPAGSRGDYETDFEEISTQQTTTGKKKLFVQDIPKWKSSEAHG